MSVSWAEVSADFERDGSLRDIYVIGANLADWQVVIDTVRRMNPPPVFSAGGDVAELPDRAERWFGTELIGTLSFRIGQIDINCHFFSADEIEFDLYPQQVDGPEALEVVQSFMCELGNLTGKPVILTGENCREAVILRYRPGSEVEWVPSPPGPP
jgi:hypothetical protein